MARRTYRGGLLFPLVLIAGGIFVLLANLGVVDHASWREILRFWPVLLIAIGVDLIVGRSSLGGAVSSVFTIAVLLVLGSIAFHLFAPPAWTLRDQSVRVQIGEASSAGIALTCTDCALAVRGDAPSGILLEGSVEVPWSSELTQTVRRTAETLRYELESAPRRWIPFASLREGGSNWTLSAAPDLPLDLLVSAAEGIDLDLSELRVAAVDATAGGAPCRLVASALDDATYTVSCNDLTLVLPTGVVARVEGALPERLQIPSGYVQTAGALLAAAPAPDAVEARIVLRPSVESLTLTHEATDEAPAGPGGI